jgi:hypothetical protein
MRYEYECVNEKCVVKKEPHEFEADIPLKDKNIMPYCPKCGKNTWVKKVIKTAFPTSHSWRP